jgi:hypothetical protein
MRTWQVLAAAAAIAVVFVLVVGLERQRNCRYAGGTHCPLFGIGLGKYGGPQ